MIMRLTSRLGLLLIIVSLVAASVPAQVTTSGRLTGVVADANGALIPKLRSLPNTIRRKRNIRPLRMMREVGRSRPFQTGPTLFRFRHRVSKPQ